MTPKQARQAIEELARKLARDSRDPVRKARMAEIEQRFGFDSGDIIERGFQKSLAEGWPEGPPPEAVQEYMRRCFFEGARHISDLLHVTVEPGDIGSVLFLKMTAALDDEIRKHEARAEAFDQPIGGQA